MALMKDTLALPHVFLAHTVALPFLINNRLKSDVCTSFSSGTPYGVVGIPNFSLPAFVVIS